MAKCQFHLEQFAFHGLESLEFLEMKNNPKLEFIHPKAFYDALTEVFTLYSFYWFDVLFWE